MKVSARVAHLLDAMRNHGVDSVGTYKEHAKVSQQVAGAAITSAVSAGLIEHVGDERRGPTKFTRIYSLTGVGLSMVDSGGIEAPMPAMSRKDAAIDVLLAIVCDGIRTRDDYAYDTDSAMSRAGRAFSDAMNAGWIASSRPDGASASTQCTYHATDAGLAEVERIRAELAKGVRRAG